MKTAKNDAMVNIALATWNGARFLPALLESIAKQTYPHWKLITRDDGSTDATREIVRAFACRFEGRVEIIEDGDSRLGAARNFEAAVKRCDAPYIAFADQDDVWLPSKLALTCQRCAELERWYRGEMPLLVHTDLQVVDQSLAVIAPSFAELMRLDPIGGGELKRLLVRNVVTGCTMLVNRALIDLAIPIPDAVPIHDWWFALVATCLGKVEFVEAQPILYRQHGENAIGSVNPWSISTTLRRLGEARAAIRVRYAQARALSARFGDRLDPQTRAVLERFAELEFANLPARGRRVVCDGYVDHGWLRTAAAVLLG